MKLLSGLICLLLLACLPFSSSVPTQTTIIIKYDPTSCLDIKYYRPNVTRNGFYTIFDKENGLHTVYCDFNSDKPFVWTLIESFSRKAGKRYSNVKYRLHFQRPFTINYPYNECRPDQFQAYRASKAVMQLIRHSQTTTHWRATCNFDQYAMGKVSTFGHRDYVRAHLCRLDMSTFYSSGGGCYEMDYINIGGHACEKCTVPFYSNNGMHPGIMSSISPTRCSKMNFGPFEAQAYNWGFYNIIHEKFSCLATEHSTTNWWFGGIYDALDSMQSVKKA
ncbi:hypothetical protein TrispH2_000463 [Trichoplax sp. H2]|uniref:Fibrinogen C-terminal domain-containing protein n=1 Tax=Trichoplax adhaerens TaxID=10228 RepID=B3S6P1_TRIAD|nr:predicted protein [Trichoplax adhaerens]EDV21791.1 predicted protein [Trichoplax adhaerens]RDD47332.1 hypothetical protein TrispH2_000463 [Trichoplax sp. H2]|eukprot:XP_002115939.1 predicted protein [Trichoplax adhaerens]